MTTSKILFRGASIPYGGVDEADVPFPQSNILMRLGAQWAVDDGDGRAEKLIDYKDGSEYLLGTLELEPLFEIASVAGLPVLDATTADGNINDYDGYPVNSSSGPVVASEAFGGKDALTVACLVSSPPTDASYSPGPTIVGGSTTGSTSAMFRLYYPAAGSLSLTVRHSATSDTAGQVNIGGLVPGRFDVVIAEVDFINHWVQLEVNGVRKRVNAFSGKTGQSVTPSGLGLGWGIQRQGSSTRSGSHFTGKLFEGIWFNGLLSTAGKENLREYLTQFQRRLNGDA